MATQKTNDYRHDHSQSGNSAVKPVGEYMASKGTPVQQGGGGIVGTGKGNVAPLAQPHFSHYKKPSRRGRDGDGSKPLCSVEGCRAWPMKTGTMCYRHTVSAQKAKEAESETE